MVDLIDADWLIAGLLAVAAYLLGSVPTAYLVVRRLRGADIRRAGSRNVGALNTLHQVGAVAGALVLAVDAAKGALAALAPGWLGAPPWTGYLTATLVVVGHNWPVFLGYRGGKGVACLLGISLALVPALTLLGLVPAVLLTWLTRNVVIGAGVGFIVVNLLGVTTNQPGGQVALCFLLSVLVVVTYLVAVREQLAQAVRRRSFRGLFYGANLNP